MSQAPRHRDSEVGLSQSAVTGVLWNSSTVSVQIIVQLSVLAVLARLLSPADFGVFAAGITTIGFLVMFADFGMRAAIVQRPELKTQHVDSAFAISISLGLMLFLLCFLISPYVAKLFGMPYLEKVLRVMSVLVLLENIAAILESLFVREMRFKVPSLIRLVANVTQGVGAIVAAVMGLGVWALVVGTFLEVSCRIIFFSLLVPRFPQPKIFRDCLEDFARFSSGFVITQITNYIARNVDNLIIGRILGDTSLGFYTRVYSIFSFPSSLFQRVSQTVVFSAISRAQLNVGQRTRGYLRTEELTALIGIPLSIALIWTAPQLIIVLLGTDWEGMIEPFQVLGIAIFFRMGYQNSTWFILGIGKAYSCAALQFIFAILVGGFTLWGASFGLSGACMGVVIAVTIYFLISHWYASKVAQISIWRIVKTHLPGIHVGVWLVVVLILGESVFTVEELPIWQMLAAKFVLLACFGVAILLSPTSFFLGREGFWLRQEIISRLKKHYYQLRS